MGLTQLGTYSTQPTPDVHPMLVYCWATVSDGDPTENQYVTRQHVDRLIM